MNNKNLKSIRELIKVINYAKMIGWLLFIIGMCGLIEGPIPYLPIMGLREFHRSVSSELFGIGLTVILIDSVYEWHRKKEKSQRLISEMGSQVNSVAIRAIEELRRLNIVTSNLLIGCSFWSADLSGAQLWNANLPQCNLGQAILINANLNSANLSYTRLDSANLTRASLHRTDLSYSHLVLTIVREADFFESTFLGTICWTVDFRQSMNLTMEQLSQASSLWHCLLPNGSIYDGRFNFHLDIEDAIKQGININDPDAMARFYGVTVDQYLEGQG